MASVSRFRFPEDKNVSLDKAVEILLPHIHCVKNNLCKKSLTNRPQVEGFGLPKIWKKTKLLMEVPF